MRVLILGGTAEAAAIARALAGDARFQPLLSLAGRTSAPGPPPIPWRSGGFGGAAGLAAFVAAERFDAVVDATHPFAARIKASAAALPIPRIAVLRPAWTPDDNWTEVDTAAEAAVALGPVARRVFLTIGRGGLGAFGPPHHYVVRSVDAPEHPPPGARLVTARGPFDADAEHALMAGHRTEVLVSKNSGGPAGKLLAARRLGVRVVMLRRPPPPPGPLVADADAALRWLHEAARRGV